MKTGKGLHIIVCIKQVPDPEGPRDSFVINSEANRVEPRGIPPVLSLFDENALEAALRIKDVHGDAQITVLSIGKRISNAVMLKALSAGADELLKVEDERLDPGSLDSSAIAAVLACAIKQLDYDLVLVGRQAADWNAGQVGIMIAYRLGIPAITLARKAILDGEAVIVERVLPDGYEVVRSALPAVVMTSNEAGELRYPSMIQRREAKNKPVVTWGLGDIGIDAPPANKVVLKRLSTPAIVTGACTLIDGATAAEAGRNLALRLRQDKVI
jgi:electron transfer flavoprotein beta subunit